MVKHRHHPNAFLWGKLHTAAHQMRHEPTPGEDALWQLLRGRQLAGYKFRRQCPVARFIVDFYCPKAGLVIEMDGPIHQRQVEADQERDQVLTGLGLHLLRFTNTQALEQPDQVLQKILEALA